MNKSQPYLEMHDQNAYVRICVPAALTRNQCLPVLKQVEDKLTSKHKTVHLDLADVSVYDSCSVAVAMEIYRNCTAAGRQVMLENCSAELSRFIDNMKSDARNRQRDRITFIGVPEQVGAKTLSFWYGIQSILQFTGELCLALCRAARHPGKIRWGDVLIYMDRCGAGGLPIVLLICFLMGLILGFQAALQLQAFGADIYVANLVGLSVCRELGPLMVAMISTGRAGSAFAAEIGTMKVSEEVDALVTMGLEPSRFLVVPKVLALMTVMPLLTICGDVAGVAGGVVVGIVQLDIPFVSYWNQTVTTLVPWDVLQGLLKSVVFALFIAAVGCLRGLQTRGGAQGVGSSTTAAVVSGIFCIIISDAVMTMIFARLGLG